jgi:DNA-binding MarR family transcriptional regulator
MARPRAATSKALRSNGHEPQPVDPIAEAVRQWATHGFGALEHMEATTALTRINQLIVRRIDQELQQFDLTFAQYEALVLLYFSREGSLPLGRMGRRLMVHPATVTSTIDLLEEKAWVRREKHPTDRRLVLATITPEGRRVAKKATEALVGVKYGLDQMTVAEAQQIAKVIHDVRERLADYA